MEKKVRCSIRRSNHSGEMYNSDKRPIGFGYQGKSFSIREGELICLPKDAIYCFTDAVIEHTDVIVDKDGNRRVKEIKIPRFNIDYEGFYVCNNECKGDYGKCKGNSISRDEFFSEEDAGARIEVTQSIDRGRTRKTDLESILE